MLAVVCAGGVLPGTCMIRTKRALVDGSKSFLTNVLLDPANIADLPFEDVAADLTGSEDN